MIVKEIESKSAIAKCGFPGGGFAINPYVGCEHNCQYCYARFMKRFTNHSEDWGSFVDAKINISEILEKQMKSGKYDNQQVYLGTVCDPYQPIEEKYQLTRKILEILSEYNIKLSILTKSDLVLRDIDLIKKFKNVNINFTINSLDEKWAELIEPKASPPSKRLLASKKLSGEGIDVYAMVGPYWPIFTDIENLFKEFKKTKVKKIFSESLNTIGGNWTGVENVLKENYPELLPKFKDIFFNKENFDSFYSEVEKKIKKLSVEYDIPVNMYFGIGHAKKFEK